MTVNELDWGPVVRGYVPTIRTPLHGQVTSSPFADLLSQVAHSGLSYLEATKSAQTAPPQGPEGVNTLAHSIRLSSRASGNPSIGVWFFVSTNFGGDTVRSSTADGNEPFGILVAAQTNVIQGNTKYNSQLSVVLGPVFGAAGSRIESNTAGGNANSDIADFYAACMSNTWWSNTGVLLQGCENG